MRTFPPRVWRLLAALLVCASLARAHGVPPPPSAGSNFGRGGGNPGATAPDRSSRATPEKPGASTGAKTNVGGVTGKPMGGAGGGGPGGSTPAPRRNDETVGADSAGRGLSGGSASTPDPTPPSASDLASRARATGKEFRDLLVSDLASLQTRSVAFEFSALDDALRRQTGRGRYDESRGLNGELHRRIEVDVRDGETWTVGEVWVVNETARERVIDRWTKADGVKRCGSDLSAAKLAGTMVTLADLAPFEPAAYEFTFGKTAEVEFVRQDTFSVKGVSGGSGQGTVSYRMDLRVPVHAEWMRGQARVRAQDWSEWRFTGGALVPSRLSVLGASLEPLGTVDFKEVTVNGKLRPDLFDASKAGSAAAVK